MKRQQKRLLLNSETLRVLASKEFPLVHGGATDLQGRDHLWNLDLPQYRMYMLRIP